VPTATARFFDRMAPIADVVEPWYEHVYARLRRILRAALRPPRPGARALDAGCGTGFQTVILAGLGYETHGLDLSARSVAVARERVPAALMVGDLVALPYADRAFDAVVCAGSTLDFVETPVRAIEEIGRVLRPGGHLLLECEHKWSLDLGCCPPRHGGPWPGR
jgi:SAM-dependent methyltransferase